MRNTATYRRNAAVLCLVLAAVLMLVSVALAPSFEGDMAQRLQSIAEGGTASTVSALSFVLAQLPFAVGLVGVAHLLRDRTPVLANLGATLAVVGGFGHAVYGGVALMMLTMAADTPNHAVHADVLAANENGAALPVMAMGLLGTVLGIVLIAFGLWRAQVGPRWVPGVLGAFFLVEFAGAGVSEWASYAAALLYLIGFGALAVTLARTSPSVWATPTAATTQTTAASERVVG